MTFLGLIFQCENKKFVKVEKEGLFETHYGVIDGYAGREITLVGTPVQDYIVWNKKGIAWAKEWNLVKSRSNEDPSRLPEGWPKPCSHKNLDMDGICKNCGQDCRGIT